MIIKRNHFWDSMAHPPLSSPSFCIGILECDKIEEWIILQNDGRVVGRRAAEANIEQIRVSLAFHNIMGDFAPGQFGLFPPDIVQSAAYGRFHFACEH